MTNNETIDKLDEFFTTIGTVTTIEVDLRKLYKVNDSDGIKELINKINTNE